MTVTPHIYEISYGSLTAPGTVGSSRLTLYRVHDFDHGYRSLRLTFAVILQSPTRDDFRADTATFEALVTKPRQTIAVAFNGEGDERRYQASDNTALNARATVAKPGSPADTPLSRLYVVTVTAGRPADLDGQDGLDNFRWRVQDRPNAQTVTLTGEYTAIGGTQARAKYLASIAARWATIKTALGGEWDLLDDTHEPDDTDQTVSFQRVYKRLLYNEASGTLDHDALSGQALEVRPRKVSQAAKEGKPFVEVALAYRADVERTEVDDGNDVVDVAKVLALWEGTVQPWLIENMRGVTTGTLAVTVQDPGLSFDPPSIQTQMIGLAHAGGVVSRTLVTDDFVDPGQIITRTWPKGATNPTKADPTPAHVNDGPKVIRRRIVQVTRAVGGPAVAKFGNSRQALAVSASARGRVVQGPWRIRFDGPNYEGLEDGTQLKVTDEIRESTWDLVARP